MGLLGGLSPRLLQQRFPSVRLTGRCFLLRPRHASSSEALSDLACVELTQNSLSSSRHQRAVPGSLMGNSYYAQRYSSTAAVGRHGSTAISTVRFVSGDLILRLYRSAVPREMAGKRVVDVTGMQTSFLNSSERDRRALATMEETLDTMHLHDGHEVPALQRGVVDVVRLQPQCVYAPPSSMTWGDESNTTGAGVCTTSFDLTNVAPVLSPLENPGVLLAQSRRLSFRSEMDAVQVARVMAAAVGAMRHDANAFDATQQPDAVLKPLVRDGRLVGVGLRFPHRSGR